MWAFNIGNCGYGESHATFKLELQVKGGDSKIMSDLKQINRVRNYDLDKIHIDGVHHFKLVGWKSRARSKPFVVQCQSLNHNMSLMKRLVIDGSRNLVTIKKWVTLPLLNKT